mmetsp:Transcript_31358/g.61070  ORF Transcript_31358/g.61070 Transcript_31358/m.61070 type:complete len:115 (+) Transcript_31358:220-564(+)
MGIMKKLGSGTARAMVDVTVGKLMLSALYPKYAPKNTRGMEMQHHMAATMTKSKKGTLAVERKKANMVLKKMKVTKQSPGKAVAVKRVHICHCRPRKLLYSLLETYPAKHPQIM